MKIEPPTEIIEEGEIPEVEDKPKRKTFNKLEYDFELLRADFLDLKDKLSEKLLEMQLSIKNITNKVNSAGNKIQGYTIKELAQLKALGIRPQSILSGNTIETDEEKEKNSRLYGENERRH